MLLQAVFLRRKSISSASAKLCLCSEHIRTKTTVCGMGCGREFIYCHQLSCRTITSLGSHSLRCFFLSFFCSVCLFGEGNASNTNLKQWKRRCSFFFAFATPSFKLQATRCVSALFVSLFGFPFCPDDSFACAGQSKAIETGSISPVFVLFSFVSLYLLRKNTLWSTAVPSDVGS